jgi:DNA-directed RNA polymerase subunit RPC12/RpoP
MSKRNIRETDKPIIIAMYAFGCGYTLIERVLGISVKAVERTVKKSDIGRTGSGKSIIAPTKSDLTPITRCIVDYLSKQFGTDSDIYIRAVLLSNRAYDMSTAKTKKSDEELQAIIDSHMTQTSLKTAIDNANNDSHSEYLEPVTYISSNCDRCKKKLERDFIVCPYCGEDRVILYKNIVDMFEEVKGIALDTLSEAKINKMYPHILSLNDLYFGD